MKNLALVFTLMLATCQPALANEPKPAPALEVCQGSARAERLLTCVVDGDTFWWRGEKFRLACIDAAEINEPKGLAARHFLARVLASERATIRRLGIGDRYERQLVLVYFAGMPIGDVMVSSGFARMGNYRNTRAYC